MTRDDKVELGFKLLRYFSFIIIVALTILVASWAFTKVSGLFEEIDKAEALNYSTESGVVQSVTNLVGTGVFSDSVSQDIVVNNQKYTLPSSFRYKFKKGETVEFEYNINTKNITSVKTGDIQ